MTKAERDLAELMAALRELSEASAAFRAASLPGQNKALLADRLEEKGRALFALYEELNDADDDA